MELVKHSVKPLKTKITTCPLKTILGSQKFFNFFKKIFRHDLVPGSTEKSAPIRILGSQINALKFFPEDITNFAKKP